MSDINYKKRITEYYNRSRIGYILVLKGSQHVGFHPLDKKVSESVAQKLYHEKVAEKLNLNKCDFVFDTGSGQGIVSTYLAKNYGCRIEGVALANYERINSFKNAKKLGVEHLVNYQTMDYSYTNFPDNHFDCIYTTETLSHSPDIKATFKEFFRILKPGGRVAFFEYTIAEDEMFETKDYEYLNHVIEGSAMFGLKQIRHDKFNIVME